jgi:hypothetical protein
LTPRDRSSVRRQSPVTLPPKSRLSRSGGNYSSRSRTSVHGWRKCSTEPLHSSLCSAARITFLNLPMTAIMNSSANGTSSADRSAKPCRRSKGKVLSHCWTASTAVVNRLWPATCGIGSATAALRDDSLEYTRFRLCFQPRPSDFVRQRFLAQHVGLQLAGCSG